MSSPEQIQIAIVPEISENYCEENQQYINALLDKENPSPEDLALLKDELSKIKAVKIKLLTVGSEMINERIQIRKERLKAYLSSLNPLKLLHKSLVDMADGHIMTDGPDSSGDIEKHKKINARAAAYNADNETLDKKLHYAELLESKIQEKLDISN